MSTTSIAQLPDTDALSAYPPLLRELLLLRDIRTDEDAERFLNPSYELHTHDPFLLTDMDRAVARVLEAIPRDEHIVIFSDYDVDGMPAAVVLADFFKSVNHTNYSHYIPHRNREGFGMNVQAIDELARRGTGLIITVDCGITDHASVARARELSIDVIVTDHHLEQGERPDACAIVNPNRNGDRYPDKHLCGAAVAFKLVQALLTRLRQMGMSNIPTPPEGREKWLLDMVGLATLSDMVPLVGENRVFAYWGLVVLRKSRRPGLQQLCKKLRLDQRYLTEDDIGFMIAPRLNAASRMGEAMDALRLLAADDPKEAGALVEHLDKINNERKGVVASMVREIRKRLEKRGEPAPVIVVGDPRWKPSLLGLAANTLAEEYKRPVFLWGREEGEIIKGSCRSDGRTNLSHLMQEAHDSFLEYGGHAYSGGFSLEHHQVHHLEHELAEAYERIKYRDVAKQERFIDKQLTLADVSWDTYRLVEQLAPFGEGNHKPTFLFTKSVVKDVRQFGKGKDHLELSLEESGSTVRAISFFATPEDYAPQLAPGTSINLLAHLECSRFNGAQELRLRIVDVM